MNRRGGTKIRFDAKFRQISRGTNRKKNVRDIGNGCSGSVIGGGEAVEWNGMEFRSIEFINRTLVD